MSIFRITLNATGITANMNPLVSQDEYDCYYDIIVEESDAEGDERSYLAFTFEEMNIDPHRMRVIKQTGTRCDYDYAWGQPRPEYALDQEALPRALTLLRKWLKFAYEEDYFFISFSEFIEINAVAGKQKQYFYERDPEQEHYVPLRGYYMPITVWKEGEKAVASLNLPYYLWRKEDALAENSYSPHKTCPL